jgi:hypothetical protein
MNLIDKIHLGFIYLLFGSIYLIFGENNTIRLVNKLNERYEKYEID